MFTRLRARSRSLFHNYGAGGGAEGDADRSHLLGLSTCLKPWNSLQDLSRDIYDVYAEYEHEEEQEQFPVSPTKKFTLNINVGGTVYRLPYQLAARYPKSRIGRLATCSEHSCRLDLCDDYIVHTKEFFFDRDPSLFHHIFTFYRTGVLWIKDELCPRSFLEEMNYWGVRIRNTQRCCRISFEERQDELNEQLRIQKLLLEEVAMEEHEAMFSHMRYGQLRHRLWNMMEKPFSSVLAKVVAVASSMFVLISLVAMTLNTVEDMHFQVRPHGALHSLYLY